MSVNGAVVSSDVCTGIAPPSALYVPCNTQECESPWVWITASDWSSCSVSCGGGTATRVVSCVNVDNGTVSTSPDVDCGGSGTQPPSTRSCNPQPCVNYAFVIGAWSGCDIGCGGNETRAVDCVAANATGEFQEATTLACVRAGLLQPPDIEVCNSCTFCESTSCSGHGVCLTSSQSCVCEAGYTGTYCSSTPSCTGILDSSGACCAGSNSVLTSSGTCCSGGHPVLSFNGSCCSDGNLNACGVCDGPASAVISAIGTCCVGGVLDSSGLCCESGSLDSFGVCDGLDASGIDVIGLTTGLPLSLSSSDVGNPLSPARQAYVSALLAFVAANLNRSVSTIELGALSLSPSRRVLQRFDSARDLSTALAVSVNLLPYGGPNVLPQEVVSELLMSSSPSSNLVMLTSVTSSSPGSVCGNGVCETGERPNAALGIVGCSSDCAYPILSCPVASVSGKVCNGVGVCVSGSCLCSAAQGYAGDACDSCAVGFVPGLSGSCVKVETVQYVAPAAHASHSGVIIGVVVGAAIVIGLSVAVYALRVRRKRERALRKLHPVDDVTVAIDVRASRYMSPTGGPRGGPPFGGPGDNAVSISARVISRVADSVDGLDAADAGTEAAFSPSGPNRRLPDHVRQLKQASNTRGTIVTSSPASPTVLRIGDVVLPSTLSPNRHVPASFT